MDKTAEDRIFNAEHSLIGKWFNDSFEMFFNGTDELGGFGSVYVGPPNLTIVAIAKYRVFIKENDLYLQLLLDTPLNAYKTRDYKIRVIDYANRELCLESSEGAVVSFTK